MYLHMKTAISFKHLFLCEGLISLGSFIHNMEVERLYLIEKKMDQLGGLQRVKLTLFFLAPA